MASKSVKVPEGCREAVSFLVEGQYLSLRLEPTAASMRANLRLNGIDPRSVPPVPVWVVPADGRFKIVPVKKGAKRGR